MSYLLAMILALSPGIAPKKALLIAQSTQTYCMRPVQGTFIAIMSLESSFRPRVVSKQGDYGLAQVNLKTWGPFFNVTGPQLLDLVTNIMVGCAILNLKYIKYRHRADWPTFYHSHTKKARLRYGKRLELELRKVNNELSSR